MSKVVVRLDKDTYVPNVMFKALDKLLEMFPEKGETWINNVRERVFDTTYLGYNFKRKRKEFKVYRNPKLDKYDSKFSYYKVYYYGGKRAWCSCYYGKYGKSRALRICTHIGACILFDLYSKLLGEQLSG